MAESVKTTRLTQLEDITECPICVELFKDTRVLPCIHTFCLKCLEKVAEKSKPGDSIPCPLCRKTFLIPEKGIVQLPKNFFVEKLLEMKNLTNILQQGESTCDVCVELPTTDDNQKGRQTGKAFVYCVDCRKNMCQQCHLYHQQFKTPGTHKLIEIGSPLACSDLLQKVPETKCDKHPDKVLEIYCFDCKLAVCMMCSTTNHKKHECSDIKEVAHDLTTKLTENCEGVQKKIDECQSMLKEIAEEEKTLFDQVVITEKAINEQADRLISLVNKQRTELLDKVAEAKQVKVKQSEMVKEEIERQIAIMESFNKYTAELKEKGTACDVAKVAESIRIRGEELLKFDVNSDLPVENASTKISFTAKSDIDKDIDEQFGNLQIDVSVKGRDLDNLVKSATLVHTIPNNGGSITGLQILKNELFVVRYGSQSIQVYDTNSFNNTQNIGIGGSGYIRGLAVCTFNNCIYVSNETANSIHKLSLQSRNAVKSWSVAARPFGLSVNSKHNLLVACFGTHKLQEYSTDGVMIREVNLQPDITNSTLAVQLPSNQFIVSHYGQKHRVCLVSEDGKIIKSFGDAAGSRNNQLSSPFGFVVDKSGDKVFVPDYGNQRCVLVNMKSVSSEPLPQAFSTDWSYPYCAALDSSSSRLYVGEWNGGRIKCFQK